MNKPYVWILDDVPDWSQSLRRYSATQQAMCSTLSSQGKSKASHTTLASHQGVCYVY